MSKWEHKGGVRIDAFEKKGASAGAVIGCIIAVFALLVFIGAISG